MEINIYNISKVTFYILIFITISLSMFNDENVNIIIAKHFIILLISIYTAFFCCFYKWGKLYFPFLKIISKNEKSKIFILFSLLIFSIKIIVQCIVILNFYARIYAILA